NVLGARCERDGARLRGSTRFHSLCQRPHEAFPRNAEFCENVRRHSLPLAEESLQDVLRAYVVVTQAARILASEGEDGSNPVGEVVVHRSRRLEGWLRGRERHAVREYSVADTTLEGSPGGM